MSEGVNIRGKNLTSTACTCGKMIQLDPGSIRKWFSGQVNYIEILCGDCRKRYADLPRIVCMTCKELMAFMEPSKDPKSGFEMKSKHHYHINRCPRCAPEATSSPILEQDAWMAGIGMKTPTNQDLIQEIEQKRLQITKDCEKLSSTFKGTDL